MIANIKLYLLGGAAIVALFLFGSMAYKLYNLSGELSASEAARKEITGQRDQAVSANEANTAALQVLATYRALDNKSLTELSDQLAALQGQFEASQAERDQIEKANPDVKVFLDTPVPAALRVRK